MVPNIIITTTDTLENEEIEKYLDVISTNVVVGTNMFSDFFASITDIFGGFSGTYQRKLQLIHRKAIEQLRDKARRLKGDCILGLRFDCDEISGKGKTMLMISASGTVAKLKKKQNKIDTVSAQDEVYYEVVLNKIAKKIIVDKVEQKIPPSEEEWEYLLENHTDEIDEKLFELYMQCSLKPENNQTNLDRLVIQNFINYLAKGNPELSAKILYDNITTHSKLTNKIIHDIRLFDPQLIVEKLNSLELRVLINLLDADKNYYNETDVFMMRKILEYIENLPDKGEIKEIKSNVFSKPGLKYICPKGHKNDPNVEFCTVLSQDGHFCELNIKGLTQKQVKKINAYKLKLSVIEESIRFS